MRVCMHSLVVVAPALRIPCLLRWDMSGWPPGVASAGIPIFYYCCRELASSHILHFLCFSSLPPPLYGIQSTDAQCQGFTRTPPTRNRSLRSWEGVHSSQGVGYILRKRLRKMWRRCRRNLRSLSTAAAVCMCAPPPKLLCVLVGRRGCWRRHF